MPSELVGTIHPRVDPAALFHDALVSFELGDASALSGYGLFRPYVNGILLMIDAVVLYYDYFLTLSREVDCFWHPGPHSWASIVFFANRYIALLGHVPLLYSAYAPCKTVVGPICLPSDDDSCSCFQAHVCLFVLIPRLSVTPHSWQTAFSHRVPWHIDVTSPYSDCRCVYSTASVLTDGPCYQYFL